MKTNWPGKGEVQSLGGLPQPGKNTGAASTAPIALTPRRGKDNNKGSKRHARPRAHLGLGHVKCQTNKYQTKQEQQLKLY